MHPLSLLKMLLESIGNVVFYCSLKSLFVKRKRFGSDILWIILGSLKTLYRSYDSLRRLLIKEHAHNAFLHMFHNIPSSIRDERPPRCHRLDSHDTKILFLRKHEPAALGIKLRQVLFRYAPKEFDRRPSHFFQTLHFRSTPDDFERQSQPIERFNRDIVTLVRDEPSHHKKIVARFLGYRETLDIDRRMDDRGLLTIIFLDPFRDKLRIGEKAVHPVRAGFVPEADGVHKKRHKLLDHLREPEILRIFLTIIPGIPHRRVHITDMERLRPCDNAFGITRRIRQHDVVFTEIELLDGQRHQRREKAMAFARERQMVEKRRIEGLYLEHPMQLLQTENKRIDRRIRKKLGEGFQDPLRSPVLHQVIMHQCDFHPVRAQSFLVKPVYFFLFF